VKAANQLLVAGTLGLVAEALVFLDAQDVDAEAAIKVLSAASPAAGSLSSRPRTWSPGPTAPGFRSTFTTRTSESSPRPPGTPGSLSRSERRQPSGWVRRGLRERWPGPQRAAHPHRDAVWPSAGVKGNHASPREALRHDAYQPGQRPLSA
jgi:hypothetical protein